MTNSGMKIWMGLSLLVCIAAAVAVAVAAWPSPGSASKKEAAGATQNVERGPDEEPEAPQAITVKVTRPKANPSFVISIEELASVEPYFKADLFARVAGPVRYVYKDKGDPVAKDELLAEIDVPDMVQEIRQKDSVVTQRIKELRAAQARIECANALICVAERNIEEKVAGVDAAKADCDFKKLVLDRFTQLAGKVAITEKVVDEQRKDYMAAEANCVKARAGVEKARADLAESHANLSVVKADIEVKESLVEVARQDRDQAYVRADLAKIRAPFDGVVVNRWVDPGSFVQNGTTAHTSPIFSLAVNDKVTVSALVPDNYVPFINENGSVLIRIGGQELEAKVTRSAPVISEHDRNVPVEVDLFNGSRQEYERYLRNELASFLSPVGVVQPLAALTLLGAADVNWLRSVKGNVRTFVQFPRVPGELDGAGFRPLVPGMYGYMRLSLPSGKARLLPSGAVFSRGGRQYVVIVEREVAHLVPVKVQVNDGRVAKVVLLVKKGIGAKKSETEIPQELTGQEEIVVSGQGEIQEGQQVRPVVVDW
jgi:multidrug resistance efflux pump